MGCCVHVFLVYTRIRLIPLNRDQPEVRLSWKLVPLFVNAHVRKYAINTPFWRWALDHGRDHCTNVRLLPCNTADNFGRCLRISLPNSCVRTTRNKRNFNPNPNPKLFELDYWQSSCPLYCKLADAHLYISRPWSSGNQSLGLIFKIPWIDMPAKSY